MSATRITGATDRRGFVLPTIIFALVIMLIVAVVALRTGGDLRRSSRSTREGTLALYVAEGGSRKTLGNWPAAAKTLAPGDSVDLGWQTMPNRASYRSVIRRVDGGTLQSYDVVTQGRSLSGFAGQSTITTTVVGVPLFVYGLFSTGNITYATGSGGTDGFDSDFGAYSAATADTLGSIASNANISLGSGVSIKGNVTAGGTVTNSGATVTNVTKQNNLPLIPAPAIEACPTTGYTPVSTLGGLAGGVSYSAITGILTVGGGTGLTLPAGVTQFYFRQVLISGSGGLKLASTTTNHVDVYVDDLMTVAGGGITNPTGKAALLSFLSCGSPAVPATWSLAGSAGAYYAVYAPNHPVAVTGTSDLYGSIVASTISSTGGAKLHYDMALSRAPSKNFITLPGSWAQLSR